MFLQRDFLISVLLTIQHFLRIGCDKSIVLIYVCDKKKKSLLNVLNDYMPYFLFLLRIRTFHFSVEKCYIYIERETYSTNIQILKPAHLNIMKTYFLKQCI